MRSYSQPLSRGTQTQASMRVSGRHPGVLFTQINTLVNPAYDKCSENLLENHPENGVHDWEKVISANDLTDTRVYIRIWWTPTRALE